MIVHLLSAQRLLSAYERPGSGVFETSLFDHGRRTPSVEPHIDPPPTGTTRTAEPVASGGSAR